LQAEDGIRDFHVTGVQTCALPISRPGRTPMMLTPIGSAAATSSAFCQVLSCSSSMTDRLKALSFIVPSSNAKAVAGMALRPETQIGRASCRDIGEFVGYL